MGKICVAEKLFYKFNELQSTLYIIYYVKYDKWDTFIFR